MFGSEERERKDRWVDGSKESGKMDFLRF